MRANEINDDIMLEAMSILAPKPPKVAKVPKPPSTPDQARVANLKAAKDRASTALASERERQGAGHTQHWGHRKLRSQQLRYSKIFEC